VSPVGWTSPRVAPPGFGASGASVAFGAFGAFGASFCFFFFFFFFLLAMCNMKKVPFIEVVIGNFIEIVQNCIVSTDG